MLFFTDLIFRRKPRRRNQAREPRPRTAGRSPRARLREDAARLFG